MAETSLRLKTSVSQPPAPPKQRSVFAATLVALEDTVKAWATLLNEGLCDCYKIHNAETMVSKTSKDREKKLE